ncbi:2-dehydropantoate 2-reductase [Chungangia koreensis]|uniref:2-dehydropantoate 2-reductase n=1 Tax=Chungangia koreensis TaxID=752657 RepID=A0ABV8X502_9LACT
MLKVIGAGAIGMLLSAYLTDAGMQVQLVTRRQEQADSISHFGLTLIRGEEKSLFPLFASTNVDQAINDQLYIIAVKSYDLKGLNSLLSKIDVHTPLLFVQNGLAHLEYASEIPHQNIAFGSVEHGAFKIDDHTVQHTGSGLLRLAMFRGDWSKYKHLLKADSVDFPIKIEENAEKMLLRKAILNSLVNPLTAILQVENGALLKSESLQLLETLYGEIITVFPEMSDSVTFEDVLNLCERTAENRSSMLSDRLAGRKTEADAITGALLRMAQQRNMQLPSIRVLHSLIKAIEEGDSLNG